MKDAECFKLPKKLMKLPIEEPFVSMKISEMVFNKSLGVG